MTGDNPNLEMLLAYAGLYHKCIKNIAESGAKDGGVDRRHGQVLDKHLEFMYSPSTEGCILQGSDVYLQITKKNNKFGVGADYRLPYPINNPETLVSVLTFLENSTNSRTS